MSYTGNSKLLLVAVYCTIIVLVIVTVLSTTIPFSDITLVSEYLPSIAVNGENMYIVWLEKSNGHYQLSFKKSTDNGRNFEKQTMLAKDITARPSNPEIKVSGKNLYVIYHINKTGTRDTFVIASKDNGNTFSKIINTSN